MKRKFTIKAIQDQLSSITIYEIVKDKMEKHTNGFDKQPNLNEEGGKEKNKNNK